ncbi:MAG: MarR family transcriptional regulator [Peptostreptococcaceae bacterium]|nr:MarR family transcriptional regulator [Peptostreptococcaceae bacterium]
MNENNKYIAKYISQIHRKSRVFMNREVSKYDIKSGQLMFLLDLYMQDGKSQEEISKKLEIDKGATTRTLKNLEEQGLITRVKDNHDKRTNRIYLTEKSKDVKEDVFNLIDQLRNEVSKSLTDEEEEILIDLLEKIYKNMKI